MNKKCKFCKYCHENHYERGIRRIHDSVMAEFKPNISIFDGLTEEEMWLMFFILNQMRKEADNETN